MLRAFLWVIIAALAGAIAWLLFFGAPGKTLTEEESNDALGAPATITPSPSEPSAESSTHPAASSQTASEEQLKLRRLILSGNYDAAPADEEKAQRPADIVYLKGGKKLRGRIVSDGVDAIMFQAEGNTQVRRIPRKSIVRTTTALRDASRVAARGNETRSDVSSDEEKAELRMSPEEYKKHQFRKHVEQLDRYRRKGGIRAINMARDLKEEIENKNRGIGATKKEER
ncbi:MAG: hypothetical protein GXP25_08585 [Planctomycetes bacterium]|nr:hypothetical protein [Planctomycetota bacterium]